MKSTSKKFVFKLNPISSKFAEPKGKEKIDTIFLLPLRDKYFDLHPNITSFHHFFT